MVTINMKDGRCAYPKSSCTKVREQLAQQKALLDKCLSLVEWANDEFINGDDAHEMRWKELAKGVILEKVKNGN